MLLHSHHGTTLVGARLRSSGICTLQRAQRHFTNPYFPIKRTKKITIKVWAQEQLQININRRPRPDGLEQIRMCMHALRHNQCELVHGSLVGSVLTVATRTTPSSGLLWRVATWWARYHLPEGPPHHPQTDFVMSGATC